MQSKTSWFSPAIFRDNLRRFWPLYLLYLGCWAALLFYRVWGSIAWSYSVSDATFSVRYGILRLSEYSVYIGAAAGCLSAMAMFAYLFSQRAAGMYHSLPVRREGLFLTNFLSGLVWPLAANVLVFAAMAVWERTQSADFLSYLAQWLAFTSLHYVFFYALGVLCAVLTGNLVAMPALFAGLNTAAPVISAAVRRVLKMFLYGYVDGGPGTVARWLSPASNLLGTAQIHYPNGMALYDTMSIGGGTLYSYTDYTRAEGVVDIYLTGWPTMIAYALAGLLLAALALAIYRRRRIEAAGDVIAISALRRVFPYILFACTALLLGGTVYSMVIWNGYTLPYLAPVVCLALGGLLGFYAARCLLQKSFAVFRGTWKPAAVLTAAIVLLTVPVRLDVLGYTGYIPDGEEVASVTLGLSGSDWAVFTDGENIARAIGVHEALLDERADYAEAYRDPYAAGRYINAVQVIYTLADGSEVTREYYLPTDRADLSDGDKAAGQMMALLNSDEAIEARMLNFGESQVSDVYIYYTDSAGESHGSWLTAGEGLELYRSCIAPDMFDRTIGQFSLYYDTTEDTTTYDCTINISLMERHEGEDGTYTTYTHMYFNPTVDSARTNAYLEALGIELIDLKTAHELYSW